MTNHPKFTESHDSAARSVGWKDCKCTCHVRQCSECGNTKLADGFCASCWKFHCPTWADADYQKFVDELPDI